jgi:hypothetical protein
VTTLTVDRALITLGRVPGTSERGERRSEGKKGARFYGAGPRIYLLPETHLAAGAIKSAEGVATPAANGRTAISQGLSARASPLPADPLPIPPPLGHRPGPGRARPARSHPRTARARGTACDASAPRHFLIRRESRPKADPVDPCETHFSRAGGLARVSPMTHRRLVRCSRPRVGLGPSSGHRSRVPPRSTSNYG